jgi:hypothetical protein
MHHPKTRQYCTLFDQNYLIKGLAMYQSLEQHEQDFCLYILCMDDVAYELLKKLKLSKARLIRLEDFESLELLAVKSGRSVAEYCWTCAPCLPAYLFEKYASIQFITYLDADLLFFSSLNPIYEEIENASSVIVEHRFSPRFMPAIVNGKYNVQWVSFRRDEHGLKTLYWWRDKCIEWCFYRLEDDRMGDQKYLDVWMKKFEGVHELKHIGSGVGPWNFANYRIHQSENQIWIDNVPLIFYHFHSYRILSDGRSIPMPSVYREDGLFPTQIYNSYAVALKGALDVIQRIDPNFSSGIEHENAKALVVPTTNDLLRVHLSGIEWVKQRLCGLFSKFWS